MLFEHGFATVDADFRVVHFDVADHAAQIGAALQGLVAWVIFENLWSRSFLTTPSGTSQLSVEA
jgi:hypothetical protein